MYLPLIKELGLLIGHLNARHVLQMFFEFVPLLSPEIGLECGDVM